MNISLMISSTYYHYYSSEKIFGNVTAAYVKDRYRSKQQQPF